MAHQISAHKLTPNTTVHIRGKLTFSRLSKLIDGEELAKVDARARQMGSIPVGRPHTSVSMSQAEVLYADPNSPTLEEQFVAERRFVSPTYPEHGQSYSLDNKSPNLPVVGTLNADGEVEQVVLESDLAAGLDVTLVLRVYKPQGYTNCGLSIDLVLVNEPIRYYNTGLNQTELAARGIVFKTAPKIISGEEAAANGAIGNTGAQALPENTDPATGLPAAAPTAQPVATPVVRPAAQVQAPAVQPAPAAQPVAQPAQQTQATAPVETPEQELARYRQQEAARNAAAANAGGNSAFGAAPAYEDPWTDPAQAPVSQGIAYSG